jgi:hypothetical protein
VRAGAERESRIEAQVERVRARRGGPRRHDEEVGRDLDRPELRLRLADPVFVGDRIGLVLRDAKRNVRRCLAHDVVDGSIAVEQRDDTRELPQRRWRLARLAEHGSFLRGAREGIGDVDRKCAGLEERIRPDVCVSGSNVEANRGERHFRFAIRSSRK